MTKILSAVNIDFGEIEEFQETTEASEISNIGTERVTVSALTSDNSQFTPTIETKLVEPSFPVSSDIYFIDDQARMQDDSGEFSTVDLGYGLAGTTDASGRLTFNPASKSISITSPAALSEHVIDVNFNVEWERENITLVNIILESSSGYKIYEDIDATLEIYSIVIAEADGFSSGQTVSLTVENSMETISDSVNILATESAEAMLTADAICSASTPESITTATETLAADATCSASAPTSI